MKFNAEIVDVFGKFKAWFETQNNYKIQVITSDNGIEYTSKRFNGFCEDTGIEYQLTTPYAPWHNRVMERKNKMVIEMTMCFLHDKRLKKFWTELVNTIAFLLNRLPTKPL